MKTIALIPAKGTSIRLPRKNLARVGGYTLVERAMMRVPPGIEIVVATDDDEIERLVMTTVCVPDGCKRRVHRLAPELTEKRGHLEPVIADVLARCSADLVVMLQPTSALCRRRSVASALAIQAKHQADSVVSVTEASKELYFGGVYTPADDSWAQYRPQGQRLFTDQIPSNHMENGAIYVFTRSHFQRTGSRLGGVQKAVTMPVAESIDIDTPEELHRAQLLCGDAVAEVT